MLQVYFIFIAAGQRGYTLSLGKKKNNFQTTVDRKLVQSNDVTFNRFLVIQEKGKEILTILPNVLST